MRLGPVGASLIIIAVIIGVVYVAAHVIWVADDSGDVESAVYVSAMEETGMIALPAGRFIGWMTGEGQVLVRCVDGTGVENGYYLPLMPSSADVSRWCGDPETYHYPAYGEEVRKRYRSRRDANPEIEKGQTGLDPY